MHAKYYHLTRSPRGEHKPTWPTRSWRAKAHLAYAPQKRHKSANGPSWRASAHLPTSSKQSSRRKPHMQMTFFVIKWKQFFGPFFGFSFNEWKQTNRNCFDRNDKSDAPGRSLVEPRGASWSLGGSEPRGASWSLVEPRGGGHPDNLRSVTLNAALECIP